MEIIAELVAAILAAIVEVIFGFLQAAAMLLAALFEFIFLALTQGKSAASEQYQKRKQEREERIEQHNNLREEKRKKTTATAGIISASPQADATSHITSKQSTILWSLVLFIIGSLIVAWVVFDRIQEQRLAETRSQLIRLADQFAEQIKDRDIADPVTGKLRDRDAWQQRIDLSVDKMLMGSLVVVRSSGPDRKPGTIDDLIEIHSIRTRAKEVGGELAKRGVKAIRNRIVEMLPGGKKEQEAEEPDNAGE